MCLAQKSGGEKGSEERRGRVLVACRTDHVIVICSPVWRGEGGREDEMFFVMFQWHGGSEGSGDGVPPPRPQAERLPGQRVQLLARQSALITCGEEGQRWIDARIATGAELPSLDV